jgi:glutathione peroxidase
MLAGSGTYVKQRVRRTKSNAQSAKRARLPSAPPHLPRSSQSSAILICSRHFSSVQSIRTEDFMSGFYDIRVKGIEGSEDLLGALRGKVALAVNVASRCGLTPQYSALEQLHRELKDQPFTVIGFPCNQFGAQEPGSEGEIIDFCRTFYDVTFPLSAKLEVNGPNAHPVYRFLTSADTGIAGDITWNFEKFLISRDGHVLKRYPPPTKPQDNGLLQDIADALTLRVPGA